MQQGLPLFFRRLPKTLFQASLTNSGSEVSMYSIIKEILKKTSDLKLKLRVASKNMCIYLAHQSIIGPEIMANITLESLDTMLESNNKTAKKSKNEDATSSLCNSTMWTSLLTLLTEYQKQAKLADTVEGEYTKQFMKIVNKSLQHHTPAVRKEAEHLFIEMYKQRSIGPALEKQLVGQKAALSDKLIKNAKKESGIIIRSDSQNEEEKKTVSNYMSNKIKSDFLPESILKLFDQETIEMLKSSNPKKRQKALVNIKKTVSQLTVGLSEKKAKELSEPITHLMRQILSDENSEVYLEALKIVKFIISSFAPHLGALDLHILIGSFIGIIVSNTVSSNVRIQVASDKVVIFFAKHNNIGPFVVARDIVKNIEKISKAIEVSGNKKETFSDKKSFLTRFLSILLLLVNQFSIVLCYESDFNDKMVACLAQLITISDSDQNIKSLVSQILAALHNIDQQTLSVSINKLDPIKKAPLLKIKIEMEAMMRNGNGVLTGGKNTFGNSEISSHTPPFMMSDSGRDSSARTSLCSPSNGGSATLNRQQTENRSEGFRNSDGFKSELRNSRRLLNKQGSGMDYSGVKPIQGIIRKSSQIEGSLTEKKIPMGNMRRSLIQKGGISKFTLPDVAPKGNNVLPSIAGTNPGFGMGGPPPLSMSGSNPNRRIVGRSQRDFPVSESQNRPPLYKKPFETQRDGQKFTDEHFSPSGRMRGNYNTQSDFKSPNFQMNSSIGMSSNLNTIATGSTVPQATFEMSTTKYADEDKLKRKTTLGKEFNKFNMR